MLLHWTKGKSVSHSQNPISEKQRAANRANATHSTGPRTPEGKARSAQNARKHGFTASTFAIVRLEELDEIAHLKADLIDVYQPINSQELFAIERIALAQQALLRAARLESGMFTTALDEAVAGDGEPLILLSQELTGDIEITREQNRNYCLAEGFHRMARKSNCWSLLLRYQAQSERMYRRAIEEFERLKKLRPDLPNEPISDGQPEENETTSTASETNPPLPQSPTPEEYHPADSQPVLAGSTPQRPSDRPTREAQTGPGGTINQISESQINMPTAEFTEPIPAVPRNPSR